MSGEGESVALADFSSLGLRDKSTRATNFAIANAVLFFFWSETCESFCARGREEAFLFFACVPFRLDDLPGEAGPGRASRQQKQRTYQREETEDEQHVNSPSSKGQFAVCFRWERSAASGYL